MGKRHDIKIWERWFDAVRMNLMPFQIRKDDRNYNVGDILILNEVRHQVGEYTGRKLERKIIYIVRPEKGVIDPAADGVKEGYVVLGIAPL